MEEKLREYAKLLIEVGLNIQKGQTLIISSPVECAHFARLCAGAAYDAGCREVIMNWSDDELARMKYLRAENSVFDDAPEWREKPLAPPMRTPTRRCCSSPAPAPMQTATG